MQSMKSKQTKHRADVLNINEFKIINAQKKILEKKKQIILNLQGVQDLSK